MISGVRRLVHAGLLLVLLAAGLSCTSVGSRPVTVAPELLETPYLYEVARHLYRWYLDEKDVLQAVGQSAFEFWVRDLHPHLDSGDTSRFAEIALPVLGMVVQVKKADYRIDELGITVTSRVYKIVRVERERVPASARRGYVVVPVDYRQMEEYLFKTRAQADFPDPLLREQMRRSAGREILRQGPVPSPDQLHREQVAYLAPISPVANETWVYWENGHKLMRFSSDIDLASPAVWSHAELAVHLYDLDRQVVVSLDETAGSNAFITRDQAGRALFNCLVRGMRLTALPPETRQ